MGRNIVDQNSGFKRFTGALTSTKNENKYLQLAWDCSNCFFRQKFAGPIQFYLDTPPYVFSLDTLISGP